MIVHLPLLFVPLFSYWVFYFSDEEVFHYRGWACLREDMWSLLDHIEVRVAVIDTWCLLMNAKDIERGKGSPCRFFSPVRATVSFFPLSFWLAGYQGVTCFVFVAKYYCTSGTRTGSKVGMVF